MNYFRYDERFELENGNALPGLSIGYRTYGILNEEGNNVIWICHALTANAAVEDWWPELIGEGKVFDTNKYFVVCDNILGSCYGTTGPTSINAESGNVFYHNFPFITIRDMVKAHQLLQEHLSINKIHLLVGGSMGGYQALEWCLAQPLLIDNLFLLATSAKETAWGIAIHTAQRMAIENDPTWKENDSKAGSEGLKTARAIGMITYRSYESFVQKQSDDDNDKLEEFKASSYINYQGNKLSKRFNAYSYWLLTKAMDTHNLSRGRSKMITVLNSIKQKTLVLGITSDILCPLKEQKFLSEHIPNATFVAIESMYGHDGFLVETKQIAHHLSAWLK
jgi:homoserine O-acetyltransferase